MTELIAPQEHPETGRVLTWYTREQAHAHLEAAAAGVAESRTAWWQALNSAADPAPAVAADAYIVSADKQLEVERLAAEHLGKLTVLNSLANKFRGALNAGAGLIGVYEDPPS